MLTRVMCYATTVCSTRVVRVGLCVRSFGRGFLPMYESREVSTKKYPFSVSFYISLLGHHHSSVPVIIGCQVGVEG